MNGVPNASTHVLRVKLTGDNLFEFQAELYENCGSYDDAGTEVRTGRRVPIIEPDKPDEPIVEFKTKNGGTTKGRRSLTFTEQEDYRRAMSEYRERKSNYKRHCNLLFLLITNSLSEAVLQRIRLQPEYRQLLSESDVLGLWRLIKNIYMSVSGNSIAQLKTKWQGIHQIDADTGRVTPLKDHLTRIDGYVTLLNGFRNHLTMAQLEHDEEGSFSESSPITLESIPTERDFLLQLVNSLAPNRYTILTAPIITGAVTDKTYEQLKADLLKLEESGQLGPTNAGPPLVAMAKMYPSRIPKKEIGKRKFAEEKGSKENKKRRTKTSVSDPNFLCFNCGLPGHYPKFCPSPPVKCPKCGRRHLEKFHKEPDGRNGKADAVNTTARLVVETSNTPIATEDDDLCLKLYAMNYVRDDPTIIQVDSGAGITIFASTDLVKDKAEEIIPVTDTYVKGISGPSLKATHKGVCKAIGKFLIVPGLQDNLLSVPETTKQGLFMVHFDGDECVFTHKHLDTVPPIIVKRVANAYPMTMAQFDELLTVSYRAYCSKAEDEGTTTPGLNETFFSKEQTQRAKEVRSLHYALLHPSDNSLIVALKNGLMLGTRLTESDVKNAAKILGPCIHCMAGKITRPTYTTSMAEPAKSVGAIVHCDLYCFKEPIIGNSKFALISLDEFSGYLSYYPLGNKSKQTIQDNGFFKLVGKYKSFKKEITKIETDAEATLASCEPFLGSMGIQLHQVPPYQHAQRIERYVRTIKDRIRCVLDQLVYELPSFLIGELLQAVIYWLNTMPNSLHPTRSPKVIMEGVKLDLNNTRTVPFGQVCMFHHAGRLNTTKREPRSELGITLGPSELTYNAVRCYLFKEKVIVVRSEYTLLDRIPTDFPFDMKKNRQKSAANLADYLFLKDSPRGLVPQHTAGYEDDQMLVVEERSDPLPAEPTLEAPPPIEMPVGDSLLPEPILDAPPIESPEPYAEDDPPPSIYSPELSDFMDKMETADEPVSTMPPERGTVPMEVTDQVPSADHPESPIPEPTKPTVTQPPSRYPQRHRNTDWKNIKQTLDQPEKVFRVSVSEALNGPYAQQSREAIIEEIRNMLSYQVGHYVRSEQIPTRYRNNRIGCFMFLKHKKKPDGRYDRTKARMVSLGNKQRKHLYSIISSSTVSLAGVFLLINYASYLKARMVTYDIKGAFLHAKFSPDDEPIYLTIGRDIASIWVTIDPSAAAFLTEKGELILCLDRFIYGLKQSPYKFQQLLHQVLRELGYESCMHDECILVKRVKGGGISLLSTHVDDIFQVATHDSLIDELHAHLIKAFTQVTFNPKADAYLGMSINTSDDRHTIKLSQKGLVEEIIDKFLKDGYGALSTPAEADLFDIDKEADRIDASDNNFLSIVMSLMYLARLTRPDILLPVSYLASRAHCPTRQDYAKLGRIIRYLKGTSEDQVTIGCDDLQLYCHCDASYGIHADGRSHTGYILSLGASHSYLHARSSKQKVTAISSTDAEILAVADGLKQIVWLRHLMREIDVEPVREVILYQDNRSSIWMLTEPTRYRRSKHILIKVSYIKEKCAEGAVKFEHLPTDQMNADLLTKPLQGELFRQLKRKIMRS